MMNDIDALIMKYVDGECDESDRARLRAAASDDPAIAEKVFAAARQSAELAIFFENERTRDIPAGVPEIQLGSVKRRVRRQSRSVRSALPVVAALAAACLLVIVVVIRNRMASSKSGEKPPAPVAKRESRSASPETTPNTLVTKTNTSTEKSPNAVAQYPDRRETRSPGTREMASREPDPAASIQPKNTMEQAGEIRGDEVAVLEAPRQAADSTENATPAPEAGTVGDIAWVAGSVQYMPADSNKWIKVVPGVLIQPGDTLRSRSGTCRITLTTGALVACNSNTIAVFNSDNVYLRKGELGCTYSQEKAADVMIATKHAQFRHIGTRFSVKTTPVMSVVTVADGRVMVENKHGSRKVDAGYQVKVPAGKAPGRSNKVDSKALLKWMLPAAGKQDRDSTISGIRVVGFTLINADTGEAIAGFDPIPDGAVIVLNALPTRHLNIRANVLPKRVGSIRFRFDNNPFFNTERDAPYMLAGDEFDNGGNYKFWTPKPGEHVLEAVPYSGPPAENKRGGTGNKGAGLTIRFRVSEQ